MDYAGFKIQTNEQLQGQRVLYRIMTVKFVRDLVKYGKYFYTG